MNRRRTYQVAVEVDTALGERDRVYEEFERRLGPVVDLGAAPSDKVVGPYDEGSHLFYFVQGRRRARTLRREAVDTGLTKRVYVDLVGQEAA